MTSVLVRDKYLDTLKALGDVQSAVDTALERYTIEQITTKLHVLRARQSEYSAQYGMAYETIIERIKDEGFVRALEANTSPTWEADLLDWEFCVKGIRDWKQRLQNFLLE